LKKRIRPFEAEPAAQTTTEPFPDEALAIEIEPELIAVGVSRDATEENVPIDENQMSLF